MIRHYIGFTLAIITVAIVLYGLSYLKVLGVLKEPQVAKLIHYEEAIKSGAYDKIPVEKLLGRGGFIEILDAQNKSIYCSNMEEGPTVYTEAELEMIENYPSYRYVDQIEYQTDEGERQIVVTIIHYKEDEVVEEAYLVLDEQYHILLSNKYDGRISLTKKEFAYLTNTIREDYSIQKYVYPNNYKMIMYTPYIDEMALDKSLQDLANANYFFIIFYILMILLFVFWLNRKVTKPLSLLKGAISSFASGQKEVEINYEGPYEFVEICESFNELAKQLEESEKKRKGLEADKQKMLADISHDLKTPITIIQGYSKAICDGIVAEEDRERYLMTIYQKSNRLTDLINTFYEYSKLEHPEFKLTLKRQDLCEYMRAYLIEKYNEVNLAGFALDINIPEETIECELDNVQLTRAFENILVNTMKHNPKGTTLYVRVYESQDKIYITIADDGVGIPSHLAADLFNPFIVGDDSRNNKQGSGLGLAITKRIIEAHEGSIRLVILPTPPYKTEFEITFLKKP